MKTTFRAVSPFTGTIFTRTSEHVYTHALVILRPTDVLVADALRWAVHYDEKAVLQDEIADNLAAGTMPAADSELRVRRHAFDVKGKQYAVRPVWSDVMDDKAATAEGYWAWAAESRASAAAKRRAARQMERAATVQEDCSFHHSRALADKASCAVCAGNRSQVVEAQS